MSNTLEETLGLPEGQLAFLNDLSDGDNEKLQAMFANSQALQREQVQEAIDSGLQIVPKLLRKPVMKMLGDK